MGWNGHKIDLKLATSGASHLDPFRQQARLPRISPILTRTYLQSAQPDSDTLISKPLHAHADSLTHRAMRMFCPRVCGVKSISVFILFFSPMVFSPIIFVQKDLTFLRAINRSLFLSGSVKFVLRANMVQISVGFRWFL